MMMQRKILLLALVGLCLSGVAHSQETRAAAPPAKLAAPKATVWFVQCYEVKDGQIDAYKKWMQEEGGRQFLAFQGAASIETWVDLISEGPTLKTILGFTDYAAIDRFYEDKAMDAWGEKLDSFLGPHKHYIFRQYPIYRSKSLSYPGNP